MLISLPVRKDFLNFEIPDRNFLGMISSKEYPPIENLPSAIRDAIDSPIGCSPLRKLVKPGQKVVIVATDITRYACEEIILPILLNELNESGIPDKDITIVVATGTHRPNTMEECAKMYGEEVLRRVKVINHSPYDPSSLVYLGETPTSRIPVEVNKFVFEADFRITTGVIEPHLFAGYSGGIKSIAVGVAGVRTISATHNISMLDHPKTRLGVIEDNLFRKFLDEAACFLGVDFIINVVLDDYKRPIRIVAGHPQEAYCEGVNFAKKVYEVEVKEQSEIVIAIPKYPKDRDLYQATRAVNNVLFGPVPLVRKGGIIIIPALCEDGIGHEGYHIWMKSVKTPEEALEKAYREGFEPGEHKAFVLAKALNWAEIVMVGTKVPEFILRELLLEYRPTMEEALKYAFNKLGKDAKVWVIPNALVTIPVVKF
ncbi:MAG: nickel-dependent lactate racemase [Synergistetes bacterium]|nr:nickel-dependent lactate racemase [Synergistota bacterium]MDW8191650.1 nickel-dependent lactate racemase [Synergistota bacterium]